MRDGFNFQGVEIDAAAARSAATKARSPPARSSGNWGAFIAGEDIHDDGFRDFSEAEIRRMYADIGVKGDDTEFHLNYTGADNFVGVTAAAPVQLLDLGWSRTFTSPQTTENQMAMVSVNGTVKATPTLTFSGVGYYRWFKQKHVDGNIAEAEDCSDGVHAALLGRRRFEQNDGIAIRTAIPIVLGPEIPSTVIAVDQLGSIDRTSQDRQQLGRLRSGRRQDTPRSGMPQPVPARRQLRPWQRGLQRQQRARLLRAAVRRQQLRFANLPCRRPTTCARA